ncbi:uncharacterized protein EI97DRAFT_165587 [Westerdykella ornata]|uniref:DUF7598 domain-containing protein n=1 Tax=Westerdykella ornata TaxID=318751 RepID=A0A6A6JAG0_WESOR|nr:uncharacterized protein EI97DRAFT_165587 [Westerdykella ornata]KAF2273247.1 hypothetical protein EI97DRAFT_165587 [Westerdykella ornata]
MALLSAEQLAGPGYIILNIIRAMNIIALSSVVASSVVMLVKTFVVSKFFFFDATSHVITGLVGLFLIVSECSLFRSYFARNWPLLSPSHGFVSLGCAMMVLGLNMLGNMNKEATSQESLGLPFWRLLVASGILAIVIGFFNVVASYIFRNKARQITARRVRSHGAISLSPSPDDYPTYTKDFKDLTTVTTHHTGSSVSRSTSRTHINTPPPIRTGTPPVDMGMSSPQPAHKSPTSGFSFPFSPARTLRAARESLLPSYHSSPLKVPMPARSRASSIYSRSTSGESRRWWHARRRESEVPEVPMQISAPMNTNAKYGYLMKPELKVHPSLRGREDKETSV